MIKEVEDYIDADERLQIISGEENQVLRGITDDADREMDLIREQIRRLEKQKQQIRDKYKDDYQSAVNYFKEEKRKASIPIWKAKHIIELLTIKTDVVPISPNGVYYRTDNQNHLVLFFETLYSSNHIRIYATIVGNERPKNCYQLEIIGDTKFSTEWFTYGTNTHIEPHRKVSIRQVIRVADNPEDLKQHFREKLQNLSANSKDVHKLQELIDESKELEQEWKMVREAYKLSEFDPILAYRCPRCERTAYLENNCSVSIEKDPVCRYCKNQLLDVRDVVE